MHSKTQVALYPSPSPPSPRVRTWLEVGRLTIPQFSYEYNIYIYIQGDSWCFPAMMTTRPALYIIYIWRMNVVGRFASKRVTFLFLYLYVSVSFLFLPFRVHDIIIKYTVFFSYCRQTSTVFIQHHFYLFSSYTLYLSLSSLYPSNFISFSILLTFSGLIFFSLTRTLFYWSLLKVCYCWLCAILSLEISAITILVYKTLKQIEPIRCRRHCHLCCNNRKSDGAK